MSNEALEAGGCAPPVILTTPTAQSGPSAVSRESLMVVVERDEAGTPTVWCDPEIVDLVTALNKGGIRTTASCSGHGERHGNIALTDGRELIIAANFEEARRMDSVLLNIPLAGARDAVTDAHYAAKDLRFDIAVAELRNIASANTRSWDEPVDFQGWAQNRARHTLSRLFEVEAHPAQADRT